MKCGEAPPGQKRKAGALSSARLFHHASGYAVPRTPGDAGAGPSPGPTRAGQSTPKMATEHTFWVGTPPRLWVSPNLGFFTARSSGQRPRSWL